MGRHYTQLNIEDRCELARLHAQGRSLRQIAAALDRAPSTIARELKRNTSRQQGYRPRYAQEQARARRWGGARLDRDAALRAQVLARLKHGWSPEQIAGRFRRKAGQTVLSHETIYRFIYAHTTRAKTGTAWRHYLPRAKWQRGWRGRRGGSPASFIHRRRPLQERPVAASDRQSPGHWEADLMLFRTYGQAVLTVHERHSRLLLAVRPPGKAAAPSPRPSPGCWGPCPPPGARPSPSTTAPSSPAITNCRPWAWKPSSATHTPPGRKAASRTPSAGAGAAGCPARPTWLPSQRGGLRNCCSCTIIRPASAWMTGPQQKCSGRDCCTSNVNPPNDGGRPSFGSPDRGRFFDGGGLDLTPDRPSYVRGGSQWWLPGRDRPFAPGATKTGGKPGSSRALVPTARTVAGAAATGQARIAQGWAVSTARPATVARRSRRGAGRG